MVLYYHEAKYHAEKLDRYLQGQGHSEGCWSVLLKKKKWIAAFKVTMTVQIVWMFVQMMSCESHNILLPNFVWWCTIMGQSVMQEDWFTVFKFKVCCLQVQGHSEGSYNQLWLFLQYPLNCWSLQPDLYEWYVIISWSVLCKNILLFSRSRSQGSKLGSLCVLYLLYHRSLGNQTGCADLLLLITKQSTRKWAYTNSSILTHTITRHATGGYFAAQGDKPWLNSCQSLLRVSPSFPALSVRLLPVDILFLILFLYVFSFYTVFVHIHTWIYACSWLQSEYYFSVLRNEVYWKDEN